MSIKLRLALLLGLLLLGFGGTLAVLQRLERREFEQILATERRTRSQLLSHWIDVASRELPQLTEELAQSDEFAALVAAADEQVARKKFEAGLARVGLVAVWVVRPDGTVRHAFHAPEALPPPVLPLEASEIARLVAETPSPRFFAAHGTELLELCGRRLAAGGQDRLLAARRWDEARLRALGALTESTVTVGGPEDIAQPPPDPGQIVLLRPLADWRGHAVRSLRVEYTGPAPAHSPQTDATQGRILIVYGVLLVAGVGFALHRWVLRPLRAVSDSLAAGDPQPVLALSQETSELGQVAQLVRASFAHRETLQGEIAERTRTQEALERSDQALRRTLDERARLGRDLHDGVIQSLYAAGMGLASIRDLLQPNQSEAAARLEQTRAALNETIHDVRNFIIGLEPEALKLQTFSHAVGALLDTLHGVRRFRSVVSIDEELANRLTLAQRVHALQITRESVSNALRHGSASNITVALRTVDNFAEFEITDDGTGFDPATSPGSGGMRNLAHRAQELGAELTVESQPGRGTRVKLVFSLTSYV
jgi:signal transduction histidine kinase